MRSAAHPLLYRMHKHKTITRKIAAAPPLDGSPKTSMLADTKVLPIPYKKVGFFSVLVTNAAPLVSTKYTSIKNKSWLPCLYFAATAVAKEKL